MRPRERREMERAEKIAQGDKRTMLLTKTPPEQRSEIAARYDHEREAEKMSIEDFIDEARMALIYQRRAEAMINGYNNGTINLRLDQLLARVNKGILPGHIESAISATLKPISDEDVMREAERLMGERRGYLRARYGI